MAKSGVIFFLFSFLIFSATGNVISDIIKDALEKLKNGGHVDKIDLGEDVGTITNLNLNFTDFNLKITDTAFLGFILNLTAAEIKLTGNYDIKYLDIPIPGFFPIIGKGKIDILLQGNSILLELVAKPVLGEDDLLVKLPFNISVKESDVLLENLFHDPDLSDYLNTLISNLLPKFVIIISDTAQQIVEPLVRYYVNEIYNCVRTQLLQLEKCIENIESPFHLQDLFFDEKDNFNLSKFRQKLKF